MSDGDASGGASGGAATLRPLTAADELVRLGPMWARFYDDQRAQGMQMALPDDAFDLWVASLKSVLGRFATVIVAERGEPVGFLAARVRRAPPWLGGEAVGFVSEVWVEPASRGRRLGARLVGAAEEWFRTQSIDRAELQVMAHNEKARALYERLGWSIELLQMVRRTS